MNDSLADFVEDFYKYKDWLGSCVIYEMRMVFSGRMLTSGELMSRCWVNQLGGLILALFLTHVKLADSMEVVILPIQLVKLWDLR
jgi:hypothetical protein